MADWYFRNNNQNNNTAHNGLKVCPGCRNLVKPSEEFCPYCARRLRAAGGVRGWWRKTLSRPFVATRFLLGMIVAVFVLQFVADFFLPAQYRIPMRGGGIFGLLTANPLTYIRMGSNFHPFVAEFGQYWRFLTYCFLHFGLIHILFNGWALWDLGRLAERLWGPRQVFATFVLTGIAGGFFSFAWNMALSNWSNSAGASGSLCGILGLLLGAYFKKKHQIGEYLGSQLIRWAVMILVFGLVAGADNAAHIGGMMSGAVLGYFLSPTDHSRTLERDMQIWNYAAIVSLALLVVCAAFAVVFFAHGPAYARSL